MRRIVAGLAGLGLIAGAGKVVYNHNGATVQIRGANGQVQNVHLDFGKKQFSCPPGEHAKLEPMLIRQGRIKLTLLGVERELRQINRKYPKGAHAPQRVVTRFNTEYERGKRLATAFDTSVRQYNATLTHDCSPG